MPKKWYQDNTHKINLELEKKSKKFKETKEKKNSNSKCGTAHAKESKSQVFYECVEVCACEHMPNITRTVNVSHLLPKIFEIL